jgi:hypothetical protein
MKQRVSGYGLGRSADTVGRWIEERPGFVRTVAWGSGALRTIGTRPTTTSRFVEIRLLHRMNLEKRSDYQPKRKQSAGEKNHGRLHRCR